MNLSENEGSANCTPRLADGSCSQPCATVLMPIYNGAQFLAAAIDSVLAQTYRGFEFLIVDDGSTDGSSDIVADYARRDTRIRSIRKANSGIADTLNVGLETARGEWVVRMDADDIMVPERIERQLAFATAHPRLAFAGSYLEYIDAHGQLLGTFGRGPTTETELANLLATGGDFSFTHPTVILRREAALAVGGYRTAMQPVEDIDLFARLLATGAVGLVQPEILLRYRIHKSSVSSGRFRQQAAMRRLILYNVGRRMQGLPELTVAEFRRERTRSFAERRKLWAEVSLKHALLARAEGKRATRLFHLTIAAVCRPVRACVHISQSAQASLRRGSVAPLRWSRSVPGIVRLFLMSVFKERGVPQRPPERAVSLLASEPSPRAGGGALRSDGQRRSVKL
jgi:glycosyltransferase involved in cell wall biosynthesis